MAEFMEVVHQWTRYCTAMQMEIEQKKTGLYPCDGCPLENNVMCEDTANGFTLDDMAKVEKVVMAWAEKHPEPVYPTWKEYFATLYGSGLFGEPLMHIQRICEERIPAHIAQRLSIEPKEGGDD